MFANNPFYSENSPLACTLVDISPTAPLNKKHLLVAKAVIDNHEMVEICDETDSTKFDEPVWRDFSNGSPIPAKTRETCQREIKNAYTLDYAVTVSYL